MINTSSYRHILGFAAICFLLIAGMLFAPQPAHAQAIVATNAEDQQFFEKTAQLGRSLQAKNARRLSPLKSVNSSYEKTQSALKLFDDPSQSQQITDLLVSAKKQYAGNYLADLFLGVYAYGHGNLTEAVPHFQAFMQKSLFPSNIERDLITDEETFYLRSFIERTLANNGFPLEAPTLPFEFKFKRGLQRLHVFPDESLLGAILAISVFTGLAFILFSSVFHVFDPSATPLYVKQLAFRLYCLLVLAYILWLVHLYFGLQPFVGGTLVKEIVSLVCLGAVGIAGQLLYVGYENRNKIKNDPDLIICPYCKHPQARINAVCASCKKRFD
jgi:hypothetical protein